MPTTAELMRTCAPLYPSFAIESLASVILFFFFAYLSILISSKQQLKNPARSIASFVWYNVTDWAADTYRVLSRWPRMHEMDLGQRFRYCRRLNATICRCSATFALISITRWLHVNNVNGMRYLSYAITCPLMQAELVLLIAPAVPCYRIVTAFTSFITCCMLISGYTASQFDGEIFETDWQDIVVDWNFHNLTTKGWLIVPSVCILTFLSCVQIPILCLLYCIQGGGSSSNMPKGYPKLLLITAITWFGFPIWWMLSYEGMSVITDTRANGVGFVCLNMISKGGYTLQMISMVKRWKREQAAAKGELRDRTDSLPELPPTKQEQLKALAAEADRTQTKGSNTPAPDRSQRVLPTGQSLNWLVEHMKQYEQGDKRDNGMVTMQAQPAVPALAVNKVEHGGAVVRDPRELTNDELMQELGKRLGSAGMCSPRGGKDFQMSLDMQIRLACSKFAIAEDSDEDEDD